MLLSLLSGNEQRRLVQKDYLLNNAKNDKGITFTTPPVLADRNAVAVLRCPIYVGYKLQPFICFLDGEYGVFHLGTMYCVSKSCLTALLLAVTVHKYLQAFICIKSSLNHIPLMQLSFCFSLPECYPTGTKLSANLNLAIVNSPWLYFPDPRP